MTGSGPSNAADGDASRNAGTPTRPARTQSRVRVASLLRGHVETLERLAAPRSSGAITDEEFAAEKTHVMNNGT